MKLKELREAVLSQSQFWRGLSPEGAKLLLEDIDQDIERNFREGEEAGYLQGKVVSPPLDPSERLEALERCVTGLSKKLEDASPPPDCRYDHGHRISILEEWAKRIDECRVKGWEIFGRTF